MKKARSLKDFIFLFWNLFDRSNKGGKNREKKYNGANMNP